MSVTPNLRLWSVVSNVSSIVLELAKADTMNKEVPSFYNFEQTVFVKLMSLEVVHGFALSSNQYQWCSGNTRETIGTLTVGSIPT